MDARFAIYQTDDKGNFTYLGENLCRLFGITREKAMTGGWMDQVHPEDRYHVKAIRTEAMSGLPTVTIRYRIIVDGRVRWLEAFSTALRQGDQFVGRSGLIWEIRKPAEVIELVPRTASQQALQQLPDSHLASCV